MTDAAKPGTARAVKRVVAATVDAELRVDVPGVEDLQGPPRASYERAVRAYAIDVLKEASNLEAAMRAGTSEEVQYTSSQIESAVVYVRDRGHVPQRKAWYPWARVAGPVLFFVGGVAMPLGGAWIGWAYIGGGTAVAAVALGVYVEFAGKDRR